MIHISTRALHFRTLRVLSMNTEEIRKLMRQAVGFILLTFSLLSIPKAFSGIIVIVTIMMMGLPMESDIEKMVTANLTQQLGGAIGDFSSFIILALLARWIFRGPKVLDRWIEEGQRNSGQGDLPSDSN